ncbi:MAG: twin-arginine translocase TatA/TatE family subunit [Marmoricola sp.]
MAPEIIAPMALLGLGAQELWILFGIVVLVFGAKKLPELARGSGQALRIFKAETKELKEGDKVATDEAPEVDTKPADPAS